MKPLAARAQAALILDAVLKSKGSLTTQLSKHKERDDYPLLQEMCFGVCRWYFQLDAIIGQLLSKPLKTKDQDVKLLLLIGLYQIREMRLPDYAVINETVGAVKGLKKPWARGLTNAVLRNYQRRAAELDEYLASLPLAQQTAHPQWLADRIAADWPEQSQDLLANNNLRPPMTLRVNLARQSRDAYLQQLANAGIDAKAGLLSDSAIYLSAPCPVTSLPGFETGSVSVQDEASQLVPGVLDLQPGQRVLDACSAPGGKTCHILESESSLTEVVSIELEASRMPRLEENLQRLGLQATTVCADITETPFWWDGVEFDRILLDAPCSATGVIRRHPDIKVLRQLEDVETLVELQTQILHSLWPCLKSGGLFLYTTCSILRQENEANLAAFLNSTPDAKYGRITADWGVECNYGKQLLTGQQDGTDGFYFALLRKQ